MSEINIRTIRHVYRNRGCCAVPPRSRRLEKNELRTWATDDRISRSHPSSRPCAASDFGGPFSTVSAITVNEDEQDPPCAVVSLCRVKRFFTHCVRDDPHNWAGGRASAREFDISTAGRSLRGGGGVCTWPSRYVKRIIILSRCLRSPRTAKAFCGVKDSQGPAASPGEVRKWCHTVVSGRLSKKRNPRSFSFFSHRIPVTLGANPLARR